MTINWIRGVNLGGWLVLERYITPYQFALTDCHLQGEFCWRKDQISAPPTDSPHYSSCEKNQQCQPYLMENVYGKEDFPYDEYDLGLAFEQNKSIGEQWLNYHFENFLQRSDLQTLQEIGLTHVRVPLPHWILGDIHEGEPWLLGHRWKHFVKLCGWAKEFNLQIWPDIHTAPGSQNGFDNSGRQGTMPTCKGWQSNPQNVERSLQAIRDICHAIVRDGLDDVVTGFGLLNEPFKDCDHGMYRDFVQQGFQDVREILGKHIAVYVSDLFNAVAFNDGTWWTDPDIYHDTYLDSHYYHVFAQNPRELSPRQHIAYACQQEHKSSYENSGTAACCYSKNGSPSNGVKRIVGEWSAATDTLPVAKLDDIMKSIVVNGTAIEMDRVISRERAEFLKNFVSAQIVSYEATDKGVGGGWFFWTLKMEGGAFAEWDFLRGVKEHWIPRIAPAQINSTALYGSCYDIIFETNDNYSIIHEFPPPVDDTSNWQGVVLDDDVVVSHGEALLKKGSGYTPPYAREESSFTVWCAVSVGLAFFVVLIRKFQLGKACCGRKNQGYSEIQAGLEI